MNLESRTKELGDCLTVLCFTRASHGQGTIGLKRSSGKRRALKEAPRSFPVFLIVLILAVTAYSCSGKHSSLQ